MSDTVGDIIANSGQQKVDLPWESAMSVCYIDLLVMTLGGMITQLIQMGSPDCVVPFQKTSDALRKLREQIIRRATSNIVVANLGDVPPIGA